MEDTKRVCFWHNGEHRGRERYTLREPFFRRLPASLHPESPVLIRPTASVRALSHDLCGALAELGKEVPHDVGELETKRFAELSVTGQLHIFPQYSWDGPSSPGRDWPSMMRASLVHDVIYQMLRDGLLFELGPVVALNRARHARLREAADSLFVGMCREDGLARPVARITLSVLRRFGRGAAARRGGYGTQTTSVEACAP